MSMNKTILLTGSNGFIGKNIKESFLSERYRLLTPSSKELNLVNEKEVDDCFHRHSVDVVIHAAGQPGHRNAASCEGLFYNNTRMFFNLERHVKEYEKMIVLGSGAIYDMRYYHPKMKEEEYGQNIPADEHGFSKYVCEKCIEKSSNIYDLRIFGIFGKYEDYAIRFISNAICKTLFDLPITIKQDRNFDYIFVEDLMTVLEYFIEARPKYKAYNITPASSVSLYELALMVRRISGKDLPVIIAKEGKGLEYSGSNTRLSEEMPGLKFTPLEQAVTRLYRWYVDNKAHINRDLLLVDK